eukprot:4101873-Amphidinium_carterae.2
MLQRTKDKHCRFSLAQAVAPRNSQRSCSAVSGGACHWVCIGSPLAALSDSTLMRTQADLNQR